MLRPRRLLLLALAALALVLPQSAFAQEPTWYSPPYILGPTPPTPGDQLSGENGGLYCSPACFKQVYVWYHCTANTNNSNCTAVTPEQSSKFYTVQPSDVGWSLVVQVVAENHDCNEKGTECRDVIKTANSLQTLPVGGGLTIFPSTLPNATVGVAYNQSFSVSASNPTFTITSGSLPAGLSMSSAGAITGTPSAAGSSTFTVKVSTGVSLGSASYTLTVSPPPLTITPGKLFPATPGVFYTVLIMASGGTAPYTFSLSGGTLPTGMTIAADGTLSGAPTGAPGLFTFTVSAKDKFGSPGTKTFSLVVAAPAILATPTALASATAGSSYTQTLGATGGVPPYTFSLLEGALPGGLTLAPTGILSGTPALAGTFLFTIRIADSNGAAGEQSYRLVVAAAQTVPVKQPPKVLPKPKSKKPKKR